jgi:outer membrane receptor protein involved in Fe transport
MHQHASPEGLHVSSSTDFRIAHRQVVSFLKRQPAPVFTLSLALCFAAGPPASAADRSEAAPPRAARAAASDAAIALSPFEVRTDRDVGFVAASALAGGRMASDLADAPVAYSVQTKEFLDALNLTNLDDALEWSVNTYKFDNDQAAGIALGVDAQSTTRGVTSNPPQRNFFPAGYSFDAYNIERFDYTRGPNSILFGAGTISGTANSMSKFARSGRSINELRLQTDSRGSLRGAADINRPIGRVAAVRINLLREDRKTWRDGELTKKKGISPALSITFSPRTELKIAGEYAEKFDRKMISPFLDELSGWDGVTFRAREPLTGSSTDNALYASHGVNRIGSSTATEYWIFSPDRARILNYTGTVSTVALEPNTRAINGVRPIAGSLNFALVPILDTTNMPVSLEDLFGPALQHSHFRIPSREQTNLTTAPVGTDRIRAATASFTHRIGDSLFLELAGDANQRDNYGNGSYWYNTLNQGIGRLRVDVNQNLPTGETNPYFLEPYQESALDRRFADYDNRAVRLAAAYAKDWKWVDLKFNLMTGAERQESITVREIGVLPVDSDPRQWGRNGTQTRALHYRLYFNQPDRGAPPMGTSLPVVNPLTGATTQYTPVWTLSTSRAEGGIIEQLRDTRYGQAAAQLAFAKKRLIILGAMRVDRLESAQQTGLRAMSYPQNFVPSRNNSIWRPAAPDDWRHLTYIPKSATGQAAGGVANATARPLDANGVPLPQYVNDRFQNDYSPPANETSANTKSIGAIVRLGRGVSAFANVAQTFNPGDLGRFTINYDTPPPSTSRGYDVGLRFTIDGGRLFASISHYSSTEKNNTTGNPGGFSNFNPLIQTRPIGDDTPGGTNRRGLGLLPDQWFDLSDRATTGYEAEITANLTPNWRLNLNMGTSRGTQTNAFRETRAWLVTNDTVLRQVLADAGVVINANGVASVPANRAVSIDAANGASRWNAIQTAATNWIEGSQLLLRSVKYTTNVYTDYRFKTAALKGLRLGAGGMFRGPQLIGYRGADTIPDPASPATRAIDDPAVDAYTPIWARSYGLVTLTAGYPLKLFRDSKVDFNLSVTNALDYSRPVYSRTGLRPYNGNLASPARTTVPLFYTYIEPRTFTLSARYGF